jgi:hypothetical protein
VHFLTSLDDTPFAGNLSESMGDAPKVNKSKILASRHRQKKYVQKLLPSQRINRGSYSSVEDFEAAIYDYLLQHDAKPKPFFWSKTSEDTLTRERRALDALDHIRRNR